MPNPVAAKTAPIATYDLTPLCLPAVPRRRAWDEMQAVASLQGLVNRQRPRLYVFLVGDGAKIGANTVVVEDVPPGSTVIGNPGHPVKVEGRRVEGPDADALLPRFGAAQLVVIGDFQRSTLRPSRREHLVRAMTCPVLVVQGAQAKEAHGAPAAPETAVQVAT